MKDGSAPFLLQPDPVRPHPSHPGCGPRRSYRHLHHQRGVAGRFSVRLVEARDLTRRHWSPLGVGPMRHLGLTAAHGGVSAYATGRLAFWRDGGGEDGVGGQGEADAPGGLGEEAGRRGPHHGGDAAPPAGESSSPPAPPSRRSDFLPGMPPAAGSDSSLGRRAAPRGAADELPSPFSGSLLSMSSPARSPFLPSHGASKPQHAGLAGGGRDATAEEDGGEGCSSSQPEGGRAEMKTASAPPPHERSDWSDAAPRTAPGGGRRRRRFGPREPDHVARDVFRSSTVRDDSNPIWGGSSDANDGSGPSTFDVPLRKDDMYPALRSDGARVCLEVRLDEEMSAAESLLVGGALSTAVGAGVAASGLVGLGRQTGRAADAGREMLGLSSDRLVGRGHVDLMPLLTGLWEEDWEEGADGGRGGGGGGDDAAITLDEHGRVADAHSRRRVERMGMLDVWVPLYHPAALDDADRRDGVEPSTVETSGRVHLLVTYEPNGMGVRRDDVVAFESFARRPAAGGPESGALPPLVPPLSPLSVVDVKGPYLLLEHTASRTVTSVDRSGNVRSSRWERSHRVRVRRTSVFVIERRTVLDAAADVARVPGDIVLGTGIGREVASAAGPIVAAAAELARPMVLWGRLALAAGGTGARAAAAGVMAAGDAVARASVEKSLERRDDEGDNGGVYSSGYG